MGVLAAAVLVMPGCSEDNGTTHPTDGDADDGGTGDGDWGPGDDGGVVVEEDQAGDYQDGGGDPENGDDGEPPSDDQAEDGGADEGGDPGGDPGGDEDECAGTGQFDYSCDPQDESTCPGGICILGMCIGPVLDPDRWDDCGDGACGRCETAENCPADCGSAPQTSGSKEYQNSTTITVWVHGFYNKSPEDMQTTVYGQARGCGGLLEDMGLFGSTLTCGNTPDTETLADQMVEVEYYGGVPAGWLAQEDIDEIEQYSYEGTTALQRYALIVAKFIRHRLEISGATHVNLACHSMGCLIVRHLIENNIENLAAENRFVRWFSSAGVIGGAQLARLYDNPTIRDAAGMLGMELNDFVIMHPDFVQDYTCVWDHKLRQGNNPLWAGMLIHHSASCDPHIAEAIGIALIDIHNPDDLPNDGIMFTQDEYFHSQAPAASHTAPAGEVLSATRNLVHVDHMTLPETEQAALMAAAGLFHRRKVFITLKLVELYQDRESHESGDGEHGEAPAEISVESEVRYNPYVSDTFGRDLLVHDDKIAYRTPEMLTLNTGDILEPDLLIFTGPVFDDMTELFLDFKLLEVDWYPRMQVTEWVFDAHQLILGFTGQVPLVDDVIMLGSEFGRAWVEVKVIPLY